MSDKDEKAIVRRLENALIGSEEEKRVLLSLLEKHQQLSNPDSILFQLEQEMLNHLLAITDIVHEAFPYEGSMARGIPGVSSEAVFRFQQVLVNIMIQIGKQVSHVGSAVEKTVMQERGMDPHVRQR